MIVIVDYRSGNPASVLNMVRKAGGDASIAGSKELVRSASKLIVPGVGAFDHGVRQLRHWDLFDAIIERAHAGVPLLGICLGMQLLAKGSEEGGLPGLGLIDAEFTRFAFPEDSPLKIPHVGWNVVRVEKANPLIADSPEERRFYFVHSFHAVCRNPGDVLASTEYGYAFTAAYSRENVYGVQFHPEKSHRFGMDLIKKFVEL